MEQLKALWVHTTTFGRDGLTAVLMNLYGAMDPAACRIDLVTRNALPDAVRQTFEKNGGRTFVLPERNKDPLGYCGRLTDILRAGGYDVLHAHGNSCTLATELAAAKRAGVRVRIAHSHNTGCTHTLLHRLLRPLFEGSVTCRIACGRAAGQWLFRDKPFTVLTNAVDTGRFAFSPADRARVRAAYGWEDALIVGHTGSFLPRKNHAFLLDAFAALAEREPSARLLLVGDGQLMPQVRRTLEERGLSCRAVLAGATDEVPPLLSAMDVFVLPSLAEGLPVSLIEAQAAGLPCIAADTVTAESDLTGSVRFLPLSAGAEAWAGAILSAAKTDRAESAAAAGARIQGAGYDITQNGAALLALYREQAGPSR